MSRAILGFSRGFKVLSLGFWLMLVLLWMDEIHFVPLGNHAKTIFGWYSRGGGLSFQAFFETKWGKCVGIYSGESNHSTGFLKGGAGFVHHSSCNWCQWLRTMVINCSY